jgi:hypothetical protein
MYIIKLKKYNGINNITITIMDSELTIRERLFIKAYTFFEVLQKTQDDETYVVCNFLWNASRLIIKTIASDSLIHNDETECLLDMFLIIDADFESIELLYHQLSLTDRILMFAS